MPARRGRECQSPSRSQFSLAQVFKRACLVRGLVPMRADPHKAGHVGHDEDRSEHGTMLQDALDAAVERGMLRIGDKAVVVQRLGKSSVVKIVQA